MLLTKSAPSVIYFNFKTSFDRSQSFWLIDKLKNLVNRQTSFCLHNHICWHKFTSRLYRHGILIPFSAADCNDENQERINEIFHGNSVDHFE